MVGRVTPRMRDRVGKSERVVSIGGMHRMPVLPCPFIQTRHVERGWPSRENPFLENFR